jgi:hypothetical protein
MWVEFLTHTRKPFFSFFAAMRYCFFLVISFNALISVLPTAAQCIPDTKEQFFSRFQTSITLPEKILSGRTLLFYDAISTNELSLIQQSLAATGVDPVLALPVQQLLGGHDIRTVLFNAVQKREVSNLVFFLRTQQGYRCVVTTFSATPAFVKVQQVAWQQQRVSLGELLQQLHREALGTYKKQNLLINETPETELPLRLIEGSRIEGFTSDLRIDRVAVRLAGNATDNTLKGALASYPFKLEFVADSVTDQQLRQRGFWYVLNCVYAPEAQAREWLEFAPAKSNPLNPWNAGASAPVYKFYFKKLEFNNWYVGKLWDADPQWTTALANFIDNLRKDVSSR